MAPPRGLSRDAGAPGQQTLGCWLRRGLPAIAAKPEDTGLGAAAAGPGASPSEDRERSPRRTAGELPEEWPAGKNPPGCHGRVTGMPASCAVDQGPASNDQVASTRKKKTGKSKHFSKKHISVHGFGIETPPPLSSPQERLAARDETPPPPAQERVTLNAFAAKRNRLSVERSDDNVHDGGDSLGSGARPPHDSHRSMSGHESVFECGVKELKDMLSDQAIDFSSCVEKVELQHLWQRFLELQAKPLEQLQGLCRNAGLPSRADPKECAQLLLNSSMAARVLEPALTGPALPSACSASYKAQHSDSVRDQREHEAAREILRILPLRRDGFSSHAGWARAVLGLDLGRADLSGVQQAFRGLMRKLHPDRIGALRGADRAIEMLQEARQSCEQANSQLLPPGPPSQLTFTTLCAVPGRRRLRLRWRPPLACSEVSPVRRYLVAALDPSYGRALTITILEPEYSEELKRFLAVEDLCSYVLAEEELHKMPSLFQQSGATLQVSAANEAGQSAWTSLWVPLQEAVGASAGSCDLEGQPPGADCNGAGLGAARGRAVKAGSRTGEKCMEFESAARAVLQSSGGAELCTWLRRQSKGLLVAWLQSQSWPTSGSKEELVDRVAFAVGASGGVS
eukprot:TRINITY_DN75322_c0_g1_i1.p1 TRINITY_DN75322_c0_g1~~TRINITY_DN75322_c0_g1_i1.p1  ORF type:complete len:650 (+),score=125.90 TRINITY_DN75322_c0_g1_i1:74-1951(+)